jgi:hypothetical protein
VITTLHKFKHKYVLIITLDFVKNQRYD